MAKKNEPYFGGYARKSRQVDWIAYDEHHRYWLGLNGSKNPSLSYRTFVKEGLTNSTDPKVQRLKDWVYGGEDFLKSLLAMAGGEDSEINARRVRRTKALSAHPIIGIVAEHYAVDASGYREDQV